MKATAERPVISIDKATERARRAYDRSAALYDAREWLPEKFAFRKWRRDLWALVPEGKVLEVGVGTGRNLEYYRDGINVTAIDFSPEMLGKAEARAKRLGLDVDLRLMDAQALEFEDGSFDSVVATFVFCSVPDPILGLREVRRALKPGGRIYLLEHVLSERRLLRWLMRRFNGISRATSGANIDRETVANVETAGFRVVEAKALWLDVVKQIIGEKASGHPA